MLHSTPAQNAPQSLCSPADVPPPQPLPSPGDKVILNSKCPVSYLHGATVEVVSVSDSFAVVSHPEYRPFCVKHNAYDLITIPAIYPKSWEVCDICNHDHEHPDFTTCNMCNGCEVCCICRNDGYDLADITPLVTAQAAKKRVTSERRLVLRTTSDKSQKLRVFSLHYKYPFFAFDCSRSRNYHPGQASRRRLENLLNKQKPQAVYLEPVGVCLVYVFNGRVG